MLSGFYKKLILGVTGSTGIATVQLLTNSIIPVAPRQFAVMVSIIKSSKIQAISPIDEYYKWCLKRHNDCLI